MVVDVAALVNSCGTLLGPQWSMLYVGNGPSSCHASLVVRNATVDLGLDVTVAWTICLT
jgi:hypothetical protein